jgi:hypothetical protein
LAFIYLSAFLVIIWQTVLKRMGYPVVWRWRALPSRFVWFGAFLLPFGFAGEVAVAGYAASHEQLGKPEWLAALPFHVAFSGAMPNSSAQTNIVIGILLSITAQTAGLIALSFGRVDRYNRLAPIVAGVAIALIAITAPVLTSTDVLFYAFVSSIGLQSYSLVGLPAASPYRPLLAHLPFALNVYGPLWTEFAVAIGSLGRTLHDKVVAFRIGNAVLLLCAAYTLRYMRYPRRVQIAFALNPMLWFYFVLNAHNDVFAVALCLLAVAVVRRYPWFAVALVAGAIALKIPFLLMGSFAFLRVRTRIRAFALAAAAVTMGLMLSWLIGGDAYVEKLMSFVRNNHSGSGLTVKVIALTLAVIALLFAGRVILTRRIHPSGVWLYPADAVVSFPWYLIWGLPYAAVARRGFAATLLLLPFGAALGDQQVFQMNAIAGLVLCATFVFVTTDLLYRVKQQIRSQVILSP